MNRKKLELWQERLERALSAYAAELGRMDERDAQYAGDRNLEAMVQGEMTHEAVHVRNLSAELIEAQVDSNLPAPKVTALREQDEWLAKRIEDMLRGEMDRLPTEQLNDMMERMVPIQGGAGWLVEWDSTARTHTTVGEITAQTLHPRQIIPQPGVYDSIEAADYVILRLPRTKESIRKRYGVTVSDEREDAPEVRGADPAESDDLVTQYVAYYRNERGGIGRYAWVGDTELEDLEDYQARLRRRCKVCGAPENAALMPLTRHTTDGTFPDGVISGKNKKGVCAYCGASKWEERADEYEEVWTPITRGEGLPPIPGAKPAMDAQGGVTLEPTRIPAYEPRLYPVILQRNVSVYGKFLGESDLDKIADQQQTANRIESKIIDKLLKSGSYITLPDDASIRVDSEDMKIIRPGSHQNKELIGVYTLQGDISQDMGYLAQVYEEARQQLGITDSFQGRKDSTATSGKAKEFSAAQAAGRLESKRVMKHAAWAALFELIFKLKLAYADEPRPVVGSDTTGAAEYGEFNRYDFLELDAAGEWYWNDRFLFSCDTSAPLASNREALWQETRMNLQTGAFGDPANIDTLILFWTKMNGLHYPLAGDTLDYLRRQREEMMKAPAAQNQAEIRPSEIPEIDAGGGAQFPPQTEAGLAALRR